MSEIAKSSLEQGNACLLVGKHNDAVVHYVNALEQAGALETVTRYVQKNKDNLSKDILLLQEPLYKKYGLRLIPDALPAILQVTKQTLEGL